jgi:hypothetical protein
MVSPHGCSGLCGPGIFAAMESGAGHRFMWSAVREERQTTKNDRLRHEAALLRYGDCLDGSRRNDGGPVAQ